MELDIKEIQKVLPQTYPFLLIDRITEFEPKKRIVSLKNVSYNEYFFAGHFPGMPIMPGVLIIEAMAQSAIVFFAKSYQAELGRGFLYYLGKVKAKFMNPVFPGDQLKIEIKPLKILAMMGIVEANASVGDKIVAKAELVFAAKEKEVK
jgi:3-hydroxyacyl-[acyl-carrier-protein] dehydratase